MPLIDHRDIAVTTEKMSTIPLYSDRRVNLCIPKLNILQSSIQSMDDLLYYYSYTTMTYKFGTVDFFVPDHKIML